MNENVTPMREGFVEVPDAPAPAAAPRVVQPNYYAPPRPNQSTAPQSSPQPPRPAVPPPVFEDPPPQDQQQFVETTWPIQVRLLHSKPVRNHQNVFIDTLSFRQPTGADINRYGNPVRINQDGDVVIDERKMTLMMSSLSGVLQPNIEALDTRDWNSAAYRLRPFFLPEPGLAWV